MVEKLNLLETVERETLRNKSVSARKKVYSGDNASTQPMICRSSMQSSLKRGKASALLETMLTVSL